MDHEAAGDTGRVTGASPDQDVRRGSGCWDLAVATTIVAELLCEHIDLHPGQDVLDVATGSGNGALAAARRGCRVSAVDPVPGLLERARERARAERLPARFQLGDARAIPFGDASFDVVLSVFGVTFAPDARQAAAELVRVCRPGGTLALTTWTPESFIGTMLRRIGRQTCPTRRSSDPTTWSSEQGIRSLFGAHVHALEMSPRRFVFRCRSPEHFQELVQINCSVALSSLGPSDHLEEDAAVPRVAPIIRRFNQAEDGSMIVPSDYVEIVAIKRSFPTL